MDDEAFEVDRARFSALAAAAARDTSFKRSCRLLTGLCPNELLDAVGGEAGGSA